MDIVLILGVGAVVGAVALLWWSLKNRPSPASANLFAGLPVSADRGSSIGRPRQCGASRRPCTSGGARACHHQPGDQARPSRTSTRTRPAPPPRRQGRRERGDTAARPPGREPAHRRGGGGLGFFMPDVWLGMQRDKRKEAMRLAAADMIDQLTICVEAGLGFDAALARVARANEGPLAHELSHTIRDMRAGVPGPRRYGAWPIAATCPRSVSSCSRCCKRRSTASPSPTPSASKRLRCGPSAAS